MDGHHEKYQRLIDFCRTLPPTPTAISHPCDAGSLRGVAEAAGPGLIQPILVGPRALDAHANGQGRPRISTAASRVSTWVIPTDEELMIAQHTRRLVAAPATTE
ncbi:MAG: hypothetical protein J7507_09830 [Pseudoxanthomonas sp.]|nr:hypothetical protein [Pseudoxanthomonas sp.]